MQNIPWKPFLCGIMQRWSRKRVNSIGVRLQMLWRTSGVTINNTESTLDLILLALMKIRAYGSKALQYIKIRGVSTKKYINYTRTD